MDKQYKALAMAIVSLAVYDYRRAVKEMKKKGTNYYRARYTKTELRKFFRSQWFELLTDLDGEILMNKINMEVEG